MTNATDFFQTYQDAVLRRKVPANRARFYARWINKFAGKFPEVPLHQRTRQHIKLFLAQLAQEQSIEDWQIEQARHALEILYTDVILVDLDTPPRLREQFRDRFPNVTELNKHHADTIEKVRNELRYRHYSIRTEEAYLTWLSRFIGYHSMKSPAELGPEHIRDYLSYLATHRNVSASTQNQALNALHFVYSQVLKRDLGQYGEFERAKSPKRLPTVLTKKEVQALLAKLSGTPKLMAGLLYGSGLRIMELLRLRIKDIDFELKQITVRNGKGQKDRVTILPDTFAPEFKTHLDNVRSPQQQDLKNGYGQVYLWPGQR